MSGALSKRIKQPSFRTLGQEALLNLLVASDTIRQETEALCDRFNITASQFNVLRILRGVHPEGYPRCEITERMLIRAPDVTRLVDRLERQGLVERVRSESDRRLSLTRITKKGLSLVSKMDNPLLAMEKDLERRLGPDGCREMVRLCEAIYDGH